MQNRTLIPQRNRERCKILYINTVNYDMTAVTVIIHPIIKLALVDSFTGIQGQLCALYVAVHMCGVSSERGNTLWMGGHTLCVCLRSK